MGGNSQLTEKLELWDGFFVNGRISELLGSHKVAGHELLLLDALQHE